MNNRKSRLKIPLYLMGISALILFGCQIKSKKLSQEELNSIVEQNSEQYQKALLSGKLDSVMHFYDEDASLSPDGFPLITGKDNIRKFLKNGMKMARYVKLQLNTTQVNGSRDYIYQTGIMKSKLMINDSMELDHSAKFFYLWKKQENGSYKITAEINNTPNQDQD